MSVGLGKAKQIIHFEDIACETSLLTHSPHLWERGVDLLLNHLFTVSHLVMISDTICDAYVSLQSEIGNKISCTTKHVQIWHTG